jgi:hypothetical protein
MPLGVVHRWGAKAGAHTSPPAHVPLPVHACMGTLLLVPSAKPGRARTGPPHPRCALFRAHRAGEGVEMGAAPSLHPVHRARRGQQGGRCHIPRSGPPPRPLSENAGVREGPSPPPRSWAPLACVRERDARGRGWYRAPAFPCPVGAQTGQDKGGAAQGGPALALFCSAERGRGAKGGAYLLRAALHSPFAHRGRVARTPRVEGGGNRAPPPSTGGAQGRGANGGAHRYGPRSKRGRGHAKAICMPPPPLYTPIRMPRCMRRGVGAHKGETWGVR